ncbi:hypothetical protein P4O66_003000 [Electrophorus voltai]|uniref:Uncharacterized protein n=1 Tax=Electrophorus voltai TaxID=2609070 RepID=A0AAD8YTQ2_9TELE|nr:hypothetical protein P4O66_003000 [Electrophorus voltai]
MSQVSNVANSSIKSKYGLIRENFQVVRQQEPTYFTFGPEGKGWLRLLRCNRHGVICECMSHTLRMALSPPDWFKGKYMLVCYKDLVENPVQILHNTYCFVKLTTSRDIECFIINMTGSSNFSSSNFQVSTRNATHAATAWRTLLRYDQIQRVEESCQYAMSILGYLPVRSPVELTDMNPVTVGRSTTKNDTPTSDEGRRSRRSRRTTLRIRGHGNYWITSVHWHP